MVGVAALFPIKQSGSQLIMKGYVGCGQVAITKHFYISCPLAKSDNSSTFVRCKQITGVGF